MIVVLYLVTAGALMAAVVIMFIFVVPIFFVRTTSGSNDQEVAKEYFLETLEAANESLVIRDDGDDDSPGSLYQDEAIVEQVCQLIKERRIVVKCLFSYDKDLRFTREVMKLGGTVRISQRRSSFHYKIADSGAVMYLTRHRAGQNERSFRLVDCRTVPRLLLRAHVMKRLAKEHLESFEAAFKTGREPQQAITGAV